jgi:uncharacterized protein YuzE
MNAGRKVGGFELSASGREDGRLEAVYIRLRTGRAAKTKEIIEDALLADFDARGRLLGVEILAPVKLSDLTRLVQTDRRVPFRKFIREIAPSSLVVA